MDSDIDITIYDQEKAPHKPRWFRYFHLGRKMTKVAISDILLYDFQVTQERWTEKENKRLSSESIGSEVGCFLRTYIYYTIMVTLFIISTVNACTLV